MEIRPHHLTALATQYDIPVQPALSVMCLAAVCLDQPNAANSLLQHDEALHHLLVDKFDAQAYQTRVCLPSVELWFW